MTIARVSDGLVVGWLASLAVVCLFQARASRPAPEIIAASQAQPVENEQQSGEEAVETTGVLVTKTSECDMQPECDEPPASVVSYCPACLCASHEHSSESGIVPPGLPLSCGVHLLRTHVLTATGLDRRKVERGLRQYVANVAAHAKSCQDMQGQS